MAVDLGKKYGPLSLRAWAVAGAGTFAVVWYVQKRQKEGEAQTPGPDGFDVPSDLGGGVIYQSDPGYVGAGAAWSPTMTDTADTLGSAFTEQTQVLEDILTYLQTPSLEPTPVGVVSFPEGPIEVTIAGGGSGGAGSSARVKQRISKLRERREDVAARIREAESRAQKQRLRERKQTITTRIKKLRTKLRG